MWATLLFDPSQLLFTFPPCYCGLLQTQKGRPDPEKSSSPGQRKHRVFDAPPGFCRIPLKLITIERLQNYYYATDRKSTHRLHNAVINESKPAVMNGRHQLTEVYESKPAGFRKNCGNGAVKATKAGGLPCRLKVQCDSNAVVTFFSLVAWQPLQAACVWRFARSEAWQPACPRFVQRRCS